jgi:hypothetical protein
VPTRKTVLLRMLWKMGERGLGVERRTPFGTRLGQSDFGSGHLPMQHPVENTSVQIIRERRGWCPVLLSDCICAAYLGFPCTEAAPHEGF